MPKFNLDEYVPVQERIVQFWEQYPDGRIVTSLESPAADFDRAVFKAEVYKHRDHPVPDATGWDGEVSGSGGANNTAHHANAETSCIGRALANLGYATTQANRPSREEMAKVNGNAPETQQNAPQQAQGAPTGIISDQEATPRQIKYLHALAREAGISGIELETRVQEQFDMEIAALSRRDISQMIEQLTAERPVLARD